MKRLEAAFERFMTGWMYTTESWMNADNLALRALGLLLGIIGIGVAWFFVVLWLMFGKKPDAQ